MVVPAKEGLRMNEGIIRTLSGTALDMAVAKNVMKWAVHFRNTACYCKSEEKNTAMTQCPSFVSEWRPSTDIRQAWQVINTLLDRYHIVIKSPFDSDELWMARFTPFGCTGFNGRPDHYAHGETAEEAMCRAVLLVNL